MVTRALWLVWVSVAFGTLSGVVSVITGLHGHSVLRGSQQHVPGEDAQPHDRPAHAHRPSTTAQAAIPSATTLSTHQAPSSVLAASPANTAIAK
jgi:hypothetical protein